MLIVENATEAGYLAQAGKVTTNGAAYSVISLADDGKTPEWSYWTVGILQNQPANASGAKFTIAENLAYTIQNSTTGTVDIKMNVNINLMGSYENTEGDTENKYWITNTSSVPIFNVVISETSNTIENVYMTGYKNSASTGTSYLF